MVGVMVDVMAVRLAVLMAGWMGNLKELKKVEQMVDRSADRKEQ
jgi:hypothetical protein